MRDRRTVILVAALAVGAVAALLAWRYLDGVEARAYRGARLVPALVVAKEIKQGTSGERAINEGLVRADKIPDKFRPSGAITDVAGIRGRIASTALTPGQVLARGLFVDAGQATGSFAHRLPDGQVAISVQVDQVHGVANHITAGDKVNILVVTGEGARPLFQNVDVLAVGTPADRALGDGAEGPSEGANSGLVTFAVPMPAAQKIALAANTAGPGGLYLTLVRPDSDAVAIPPVSPANLFQGPLSPYA